MNQLVRLYRFFTHLTERTAHVIWRFSLKSWPYARGTIPIVTTGTGGIAYIQRQSSIKQVMPGRPPACQRRLHAPTLGSTSRRNPEEWLLGFPRQHIQVFDVDSIDS